MPTGIFFYIYHWRVNFFFILFVQDSFFRMCQRIKQPSKFLTLRSSNQFKIAPHSSSSSYFLANAHNLSAFFEYLQNSLIITESARNGNMENMENLTLSLLYKLTANIFSFSIPMRICTA